MLEPNEVIALLVGVSLGVLAAALTLIALYPAIIGFAKASELSAYLESEKQRKAVFRWLAVTAGSSWCGLVLTLVHTYLENASLVFLGGLVSICTIKTTSYFILAASIAFTALGILAIARGGWVIVRMTLKIL